jgi:2-phosphoglycerate kinase
MAVRRDWDVLLLGGAAGTGKTRVSYRLARLFGVGITEVDDFQVVLERMTTPQQQPELHFWRTHPDPASLKAEEIQAQGVEVLRVMSVALEAVIENHLESGTAVVLEGDFIDPELAVRTSFGEEPAAGRVRALFLVEPDERQLLENFLTREPSMGPQTIRAQVSRLHSERFRRECKLLGVPCIEARPWNTLLDRVLAAI